MFRRVFLAGCLCALAGGAVPAHAADPIVAAAGDVACDPTGASFNNGEGDATHCRQMYTSELLVEQRASAEGLAAVLVLGDAQYDEGTLEQFMGSYDPSWGRVKDITYPAIGNHEYRLSPGTGYFDYFNGVGNQTGPAGNRDKGYYSFNVGDWHLIALNSMCAQVGGCGAGSPQEQWLRADLAADAASSSPASCTLAYWHHPLFNSGPEGTYADTAWNTTALWQALYEAGADLAMAGHAHVYQRFGPQNAIGNADPQHGLRELVVGTGGASFGSFSDEQPNLEFRDNTRFGVIRLALQPNGYEWKFVDEFGLTTDSGSAGCHTPPPTTAPPETSIGSGPTGTINTGSPSFSFTSTKVGSSFQCKLNGPGATVVTETVCTPPKDYSSLSDGAYTFSVYAIAPDGSADGTPASRAFTVDTVPPNTSITATSVKKNTATFSFTSSEAGSTFRCRLDGGSWTPCTSPRTYTGLKNGSHRFDVYATDAAGNPDATPASKMFTSKK